MYREYSNIIVKRIASLCEQRGLSINALSNMSGISRSTLENLMTRKTFNPRMATLHKIALAFSMTLSEFLDFPELNNYAFDEEDE